MSKYSEIEIQTAKRLHDAGYKWLSRDKNGELCARSEKPHRTEVYWAGTLKGRCVYVSGKFAPIFESIKWEDNEPTSIEGIISPQILDDTEKRYLSAVIRPFRNKVLYIRKSSLGGINEEYISIHFIKCDFTCLPNFKRGTMYKGMEIDRQYTLEELGL